MNPEQIAEQIDEKVETITRTMRRYKKLFLVLPDGRCGLADGTA
jgi:hypothetical protein